MKARGAFAVHLAITSGCGTPSFAVKSKYRGGFFGSGDQAAADASWAFAKKGRFAASAGPFIAATSASNFFSVSANFAGSAPGGGPAGRGDKQQGLMMYRLPNTSGYFIPIRVAPYPPIEWPTRPRLSRAAIVR